MKLSQNSIESLRRLMKDNFNKDMTSEEANEIGLALLRVYVAKHVDKDVMKSK